MTARPDEVVAWLRPTDAGTDSECLFVCAANDPDSFPVVRDAALQSANARLAELIEENAASEEIWARKCDELDKRLAVVLALGDELTSTLANADPHHPVISGAHSVANRIRRAAAGEGDANQGDSHE